MNLSKIITTTAIIATTIFAAANCAGDQKALKTALATVDTIAVISAADINAENKNHPRELYIDGVQDGGFPPTYYERQPKSPYPAEYATIIPEVINYMKTKFPDKKLELVTRDKLPVKDGKINWGETKYNMYYVLDFRAYYKMNYNQSLPRQAGYLSSFQFESSLNLSAYGKNEKGEYKNIALSGLFPNYTLSSITVTDPNWMNNHYSYMVESNPAMYLKLLLDYKPFDQLQIVDPTIATAKKNLDKFAEKIYLADK